MTRRIGALLVALLVLAATLGTPRRAHASDNLQYIIPAAVAGAVALVVIIAIVMADRTEPEYELVQQPLPKRVSPGGVRLAPDCHPGAQGLPLLCW